MDQKPTFRLKKAHKPKKKQNQRSKYRNIAREILEKHRTKYQKLVQDFVSFRFGLSLPLEEAERADQAKAQTKPDRKLKQCFFYILKNMYILFLRQNRTVCLSKKKREQNCVENPRAYV